MSSKHNPSPRRVFTPEFKTRLVLQLLSKERTVAELCREHGLRDTQVHQWRQSFLERAEHAFAPETPPKESKRIAELEQLVGQQALELAILKRALGR
jgi:putative transposase